MGTRVAVVVAALILLTLAGAGVAARPVMPQSPRAGDCAEWRACRELALAAAERREFELFHDLAWRAVQTGPAKDPSLMFLLARAQALSGRPHDALIMLQRLAEMGTATDAATNDDFNRVRQLPGWPDVEARIAAVARGTQPLSTIPTPSSGAGASSPSSGASLSVLALAAATQPVRFSTRAFAVSGLAYDAPSHRFVLGDRLGRKLIVVDERSSHSIDLVRAESAGFLDIAAVEIDAKRGDLWVASGTTADGAGTLHRLQLVSGRPLRAFHAGVDLGPVKLVDLALGAAGAVLVLDSLTPQLLMLRPGGTALERIVRIDVPEPVSIAARADGELAFVAHRDGISRIDLKSRTISLVAAPKDLPPGHLERIRWRDNALFGIQVDGDGLRHVIRFEMNARGSTITKAIRLEPTAAAAAETLVTLSGDDLVYLKSGAKGGEPSARNAPDQAEVEFVVYRVPLP